MSGCTKSVHTHRVYKRNTHNVQAASGVEMQKVKATNRDLERQVEGLRKELQVGFFSFFEAAAGRNFHTCCLLQSQLGMGGGLLLLSLLSRA